MGILPRARVPECLKRGAEYTAKIRCLRSAVRCPEGTIQAVASKSHTEVQGLKRYSGSRSLFK